VSSATLWKKNLLDERWQESVLPQSVYFVDRNIRNILAE